MKDTNNLLDYNAWSAGEYENNTDSMTPTALEIATTSNYSDIGENSFILINNTDSLSNAQTKPVNISSNTTYTFSTVVYTPITGCNLILISDKSKYGTVAVSKSDKPQIVSVSYTTDSLDSRLYCRVTVPSMSRVYIDNLRLG